MKRSAYEAAVLYDYSRREDKAGTSLACYVVLQLDHYSAGLCLCNERGETRLVDRYEPAGQGLLEDLTQGILRLVPAADDAGVRDCLSGQLDEWNGRMRTYLRSERRRDAEALKVAGACLRCSQLEEAFAQVFSKLGGTLEAVGRFLKHPEIRQKQERIILAGYAARFYPVEYLVREELSFDPFLADKRFVSLDYPDAPERIIPLGEELIEADSVAGHDIAVLLYDAQQEDARMIPLAAKDQPQTALEKPEYVGPVFADGKEALTLSVDGKRREIPFPYPAGWAFDLAVRMEDGKLFLNIRRYGEDGSGHDVPLPPAEGARVVHEYGVRRLG